VSGEPKRIILGDYQNVTWRRIGPKPTRIGWLRRRRARRWCRVAKTDRITIPAGEGGTYLVQTTIRFDDPPKDRS
jgi:hypothetical protein